MLEEVLFYVFSFLAIIAGVSVIAQRNPIASAISLVTAFFCLAAIYVLLGAHFVAVIQILVYAGAIMVLFLFVIMLLNVRDDGNTPVDISTRGVVGMCAATLLGGTILVTAGAMSEAGLLSDAKLPEGYGTIESVGFALFGGHYLLPFEVISILLTIAVVGAVVLAKREL